MPAGRGLATPALMHISEKIHSGLNKVCSEFRHNSVQFKSTLISFWACWYFESSFGTLCEKFENQRSKVK